MICIYLWDGIESFITGLCQRIVYLNDQEIEYEDYYTINT